MIPFPNISPEIFSISLGEFELTLRWYAVSYIAGFVVATYLIRFFIRRDRLWRYRTPPFDVDQADTFITYLILGVIIGGRLGYVLFYNFAYYYENPGAILRVWDGGMAFHGGFIGVVIAVILFTRYNGIPLLSAADLIAIASPPGLMFGRLANFVNAELWGRPTDAPWGIIFPGERAQTCSGILGDCARHPSQLYEAGLEGLLLFVLLIILAYLGCFKRPGLITGVFIIGYGISRYIVEFFRVADPQFVTAENPLGYIYNYGDYGITMGQLLSLPMIFVGVIFILIGVGSKTKG